MIDAHVHLWQIGRNGCAWPPPDLAPIHRDFALGDLATRSGAEALDGVILVQSQEEEADTEWLLALAAGDPRILGVVGWTDLAAPGAPARIAALADRPRLRGLRPMVQDRPADWYDSPALEPAWRAMAAQGLVLDALVRPRHLDALARLAGRHPGLAIVVDHGAKPDLSRLGEWEAGMRRLAAFPNVACKLSGLVTELRPGEDPALLDSAFDRLWAIFGPERLIWGSDWPVVELASDYAGWLGLARRWVPPAHRAAVFAGNARWIYGLAAAGGEE